MKVEITMNKEEFMKVLKTSLLPAVPADCELTDVESTGYPVKGFLLKLETRDREETK